MFDIGLSFSFASCSEFENYKHFHQVSNNAVFTWKPPFIDSPNQLCFFSGPGLVHQFFFGTLEGLALRHVSPVSMLQNTLMASSLQPWLGSIQYSPTKRKVKHTSKQANKKHYLAQLDDDRLHLNGWHFGKKAILSNIDFTLCLLF